MNEINESLLESIELIEEQTLGSEISVLCSMMDEYTKMGMLMEYADESILQEYSIINENEFILESDKPKEGILAKLKNVWSIIVQALKKAKEWIVSKCKKIISKLKREPQAVVQIKEKLSLWDEQISQLEYSKYIMTLVRMELKHDGEYTEEIAQYSFTWSDYIDQEIKAIKEASQKIKGILAANEGNRNTEYTNEYSEIIEDLTNQLEEILNKYNAHALNIPPILDETFKRIMKEYPKAKYDQDMKKSKTKHINESYYMITESASSMNDLFENILNEVKKVNVKETIIPSENESDFKRVLTEEINNSKNKDLIEYIKGFHDKDRVDTYNYLDGHSVKIPVIKRSFFDQIYQIANLINRSDYKTIENELDLFARKSKDKMFVALYLEYKPIYSIEKDLEVDGLIKFIQDLNVDSSNKLSTEEVQKVVNRINKDIVPMVLTLTNISNGYITCYYNAINKMNVDNKGNKNQ